MAVTTNTRKLAALLGASGAGIGTDGKLAVTAMGEDIATQAELDAAESVADKTQTNLAVLAFKVAVNNDLVKYSLKDQIVDEYEDASGVNTGDSTNEVLTAGVYGTAGLATATGGTITYYGDYAIHTFLSGGTFTPSVSGNVDWLVVAGGGGGGGAYNTPSGGGGAGGFRTGASHAVTATGYTITVGAGGTGGTSGSGASEVTRGSKGGNSVFSTVTSEGGGGGGGYGLSSGIQSGETGGSGGGQTTGGSVGASTAITPITGEVTTVQGYAGGSSIANAAGGGGGASEVGNNASSGTVAGAGGDGVANSYRTNSAVTYAGGGGAGVYGNYTFGAGGSGGGGAGNKNGLGSGVAGSPNTGGGGGGTGGGNGDFDGGVGGTGIVVIRTSTAPETLILQSSDTTAEAVPTHADMVILVEDAGSGVGTVNTHVKGWISRYETGGTKTWTEGVLVDEGDWGTDKRILAFHDLDISAQTSGTQMAYKITTHSVSAVYNTKIHATSIGWR